MLRCVLLWHNLDSRDAKPALWESKGVVGEGAELQGTKISNQIVRLASNLSGGTQSDPTISPVTTAIMITTSNSLLGGSGRSNQVGGDLLHTMDVVGLPRVRTEFHSLLIIPLRAPHPVERDR